jgi:hypothetical protein
MGRGGHVARIGAKRNAHRILVGKPEGKKPVGRHTQRWEDNVNMDLRETGWGRMDWIHLAHGPMESSCEHCNEPSGSIKCWEFIK